jgi:hypothetical protein
MHENEFSTASNYDGRRRTVSIHSGFTKIVSGLCALGM